MKRSCVSAITSIGTNADEQAAGRAETERPRVFEELAVLRRKPGRGTGRHVDERPADVLMPVDADEVADEGRETRAREEPALAAFEAPVLVIGEVDIERELRVRAHRADVNRLESEALLDQTKLKTASVRGLVR